MGGLMVPDPLRARRGRGSSVGGDVPQLPLGGAGAGGGMTTLAPVGSSSGPGPTSWTPEGGYGSGTHAPAGPAPATVPGMPGSASLTAQTSPDMDEFMAQYKKKLGAVLGQSRTDPNLEKQVGRLDERLSADTTQRATDLATSRIRDQAAGRHAAKTADLGRRGMAGSGGVEMQQHGQIDSEADRASAGAAANIALGREQDLDRLVLGGQGIMEAPGRFGMAQDQMGLGAISGGYGMAEEPARLALGQGQLALDAYRTSTGVQQADQDRQLQTLLALLRL